MGRSTHFLAAAFLSLAGALPVQAAWRCSIHPPKGASDSQLASMAKLSRPAAEKIALERLKRRGSISEKELEAEHGCLIWSFDIRVPGLKGVEEVNVDAGNGKVLDVHHESASQEAAEK